MVSKIRNFVLLCAAAVLFGGAGAPATAGGASDANGGSIAENGGETASGVTAHLPVSRVVVGHGLVPGGGVIAVDTLAIGVRFVFKESMI